MAEAQALKVAVLSLEARNQEEIEKVLSGVGKGPAAGTLRAAGPIGLLYTGELIAEAAAKQRLPAMYSFREYVDAGGTMSYGTSFPDLFRRAATYVDKILKGRSPADLPVEQRMKFEFIVNPKVVQQWASTRPADVLVRADRVIR